eukprot:5108016-Pyramimonas_sp.AAC.1
MRTTLGGMKRLDWGRQRWRPRQVWSAGANWRTSASIVASHKPRRWTCTGRFLLPAEKVSGEQGIGGNRIT